ncbi:MAG: YkvA family protein [Gammaproteobacteria bacterium]|nr:YkvA family protein [Gammaproteobacteria bacterium]
MATLSAWRQLVAKVRTEINVYRRVLKHPRTPCLPRWLLGFALLYLLSPVDLVPDWFPIIGQLDDLLVVPFLIITALKRIPPDVIEECRRDEITA